MSEIYAALCELADRRVLGQVFLYAPCGFSYAGVLHHDVNLVRQKETFLTWVLKAWRIGEFTALFGCPYILPISSCLQSSVFHWSSSSRILLSGSSSTHTGWGGSWNSQ